jgi:secreted trypsin-like serine protease
MAEVACFEAHLGHAKALADQQLQPQLPATGAAVAAGSTAVAVAIAAAAEHMQMDHPTNSVDGQPAATASQDSDFEAAWTSFGHGLEAPKLLAAKQKQFAAVVAAVLAGPLRVALP